MKILKYCSKAVLADSRVASSLAALMRSNPGKPVRSQSWNGGMGWRWQTHTGEIQHMVCCVWSRIKTWKFPHPWVPASVQGAMYIEFLIIDSMSQVCCASEQLVPADLKGNAAFLAFTLTDPPKGNFTNFILRIFFVYEADVEWIENLVWLTMLVVELLALHY